MSTKISQFDTSGSVNNELDYVPFVRDNEDGTFSNYKATVETILSNVPAPATPTLQQVTDAGNATTNDITSEGVITSKFSDDSGGIAIGPESISIRVLDKSLNLVAALPTDVRTQTFQDASGTIALLSDITGSTLQQVTDAGNTTTNDLIVTSVDGVGIMSYKDGSIDWHSDFTGFTRTLNFGTPSSDQTYTLPEAGGILATNLQTATDGGATTSNNMTVDDGAGRKSTHANDGFGVLDSDDNYIARVYNDSGNGTLRVGDASYSVYVSSNPLTVSHTQKLQDDDGTIALEETMTLDKVLTAGNTSSTTIRIGDYPTGIYSTMSNDKFELAENGSIIGGLYKLTDKGLIILRNTTNGRSFSISINNVSANTVVEAPSGVSGTMLVGAKGTATLSSGTVTISDTNVKSTSVVNVNYQTPAGTLGVALKATVSAGSGFTITSIVAGLGTQTLDTSTVQYTIVY